MVKPTAKLPELSAETRTEDKSAKLQPPSGYTTKVLGKWLKKQRKLIGRSLRDAARLGGCSDGWLCQLETGHTGLRDVRADSISKLSIAYDIDILTLLEVLRVLSPLQVVTFRTNAKTHNQFTF